MRNGGWGVALVVVGLVVGPEVRGQDPSPWVGRQVVFKARDPLRRGFRVYQVERVDGDRLWLAAGGVSGWARSDEVIPFDQAVDFFTQAIRADPGAAKSYVLRGLIREARGEYDRALADYGEAIRLDPRSAVAFHNRGIVWSHKKEFDRALADLNEAIKLDPKRAPAFNDRGNVWSDKREYDRALADFDEAIRLDPKFAGAFSDRGNTWSHKKEYDKALADYNEAIRLDPKLASAFTTTLSTEPWFARIVERA